MTISTLTRTKQYNGDNSTTVFPYDFNIQAESEIEVYLGTPVGAPTSWTKKTLTTHYTLSGVGTAGGGNVTFTSGNTPPTGTGNVFIRRVTAKTQTSDYVENDPFSADTVEGNLDKLTQITQDKQEEIDRCFKLGSIGPDAGTTEVYSVAADRANMLFAFDDDGDFSVTQEIGTSKGNWAASTAYVQRDIVKDTGASPQAIYNCLEAHTSSGSLPISTNTDAAKWRLLVEDGAVGATGAGNGLEMAFESNTADSDQGAGKVWLNNGTASSATVLYMDDVDSNAVNINSFVDSWDDSTNLDLRGTIVVKKATAPENYHIYNVTGAVTSASTYSKIAVTHVVSAGTISDGNAVDVQFVRTGDRGPNAGLDMIFDTATADSDQGAGTLWLNHGTVSSATVVYIDDVDDNGVSINSLVDSFDDSSSSVKGHIQFEKQFDPAVFAMFNVTGSVTSASTYSKVACTYVTGAGSFADGDKISATFIRGGDKGDQGVRGNDFGLDMTFESNTADSDQGVGKVWFNNGTLASASVMYMDDVDANSASINAYMDSWDDSTHTALRGTVKITKQSAPANFAIYNVTGAVTSASTYSKVAVTYVTGAGSFSDGDASTVAFVRTGNDGGGMANVVEDTSPQLGGDLDCNGAQIQWSKGSDVSSATALSVGTDGNYFDVTGTTTITSINTTGGAGTQIKLHFDGALTLTHHATDLILPGGANITTAAGDEAEFIEYASGDYRCTNYTKASGLPVATVATLDTAQTFTKGQRGEITALTDGATITPDFADSNNFSVTLAGNRTLANPSNLTAGQSGSIFITQDGTGSRTLAYGSYWDFVGGTAPTLTTTASKIDRIDYVVRTTGSIHAVASLDLS